MKVHWPSGHSFSFTVFDDPDAQPLSVSLLVYGLLADLGFRTTKGIWPIQGEGTPSDSGMHCEDEAYARHCLDLQRRGFEMGLHNVAWATSRRTTVQQGLDRYRELFAADPTTFAQHFNCRENVYWGDQRLSGWRRSVYNLLTRNVNSGVFSGSNPSSELYWSDLVRERISYVRNFVFAEINTLQACPMMPYHDPERPDVPFWFASSEGANVESFVKTISEANQDRLVEAGGCCIMYTHFGHGFVKDGKLDERFVRLMTRLAGLGGWYVPVSTVLNHIRAQRGPHVLTDAERTALERKWLFHKIRWGTA